MKNSIVKAVLFDFDGTLTHPGALDFGQIKQSLGCPPDKPVLEHIEAMDDPGDRVRAHRMLAEMEMAAAEDSEPNPGAEALVRWCRGQGLRLAILTRNLRASVLRALENFSAVGPEDFELINRIFEKLYHANPAFTLADILALLRDKPGYRAINEAVSHRYV